MPLSPFFKLSFLINSEQGGKFLNDKQITDDNFVVTPYIKNIISRTIDYISSGFPVHFTGPTGIGKTSIAYFTAKELKKPITIIRGHHNLTVFDLIGRSDGYKKTELMDNYIHSVYKKEVELRLNWVQGQLATAVKDGHILIYDEFTRTKPEVNNLFLYILEEKIMPLYGSNQKINYIPVHKDFSVIFTSNPLEYSGVYQTQDALIDRMITINLNEFDHETEIEILKIKYKLSWNEAHIISQLITNVRNYCRNKNILGPSLRASMMIAKIAKTTELNIDPKDEMFKKLSYDVMWSTLSKCFNNDQMIKEFINNQCQNI